MAALISAAGVASSLVYNVKMENNQLTRKEVFSLDEGKYLKRLYRLDFSYDRQGQVTGKKTYVWNEATQDYVLMQTESFNQAAHSK
jgi:hypothetical protein